MRHSKILSANCTFDTGLKIILNLIMCYRYYIFVFNLDIIDEQITIDF